MSIKEKILKTISYDPVAVQNMLVESINKESGFDLLDPTNSFTMLLEANSATAIASKIELLNFERRLFPALATNESDLFGHMVEFDEEDFFATPTATKMRMKIPVTSILKFGATTLDVNAYNIYKVMIPKNSTITVDNIDFTIMNDILITLNTQGEQYRVFVENIVDDQSVTFKNTGNIISTIETNSKNEPWVIFDIDVLQVTHLEIEELVTNGIDFNVKVPFKDQYYLSRVYYRNDAGNLVEIPKTFTDTKFDPDKLSIFIRVQGDHVTFNIPKIYIDKGFIKGSVTIEIYTTKGELQLSLSGYTSKDYSFSISRYTPTPEKAASIKMNYEISSTSIISGGVNTRDIKEMKTNIIHRINGSNKLPITERQLVEFGKKFGFYLTKAVDTITNRLILATRDKVIDEDLPTSMDIYNMSTTITNRDGGLTDTIDITDNLTIIKPNTLFKNSNSKISIMTTQERAAFENLSTSEKIVYLNTYNILYNPFLYIINNDVDTTTTRVYDIDRANMDMVTIINKNIFLKENVNINGYNIFKTDTGYDIFFRLIGNNEFEKPIIKDNVRIQLKFTTIEGADIYYHTSLNPEKTLARFGDGVEPLHYVHINSDFYINKSDQISISDGTSSSKTNFVDIHTECELVIYYPNTSIVADTVQQNANNYLVDNNLVIKSNDNTLDPIGMTKEKIKVNFADNMKYLWRRALITYNDRKYLTHNIDVPLTYESNVYAEGNCGVVVNKDANGVCTSVVTTPIHKAGDPVLDSDGNPVIKYKAGTPILDENGLPKIDKINGITKIVDILMLDYNYAVSIKPKYKAHVEKTIELIRDWVLTKMTTINEVALEQTEIIYYPSKNNTVSGTHIVSPTVILYQNSELNNRITISEIYNNIGKILNRYFSKRSILISEIENSILEEYPDLVAVKIKDYLDDDPRVITIKDNESILSLATKMDLDSEIIYDFKIELK